MDVRLLLLKNKFISTKPHRREMYVEDIPYYDGNSYSNVFVNWIAEMERIFEHLRISDYERVKLVAFKLRGCAYF